MSKVNLKRFEERMLKLKGVKLPASGYKQPSYSSKGRTAQVLNNQLYGTLATCPETSMDTDELVRNEVLDDILTGVVTSFGVSETHKGFKINKATVRSMLDRLPELSQLSIMDNYGYGRQQASKYLQACRMVKSFYSNHLIRTSLYRLGKYVE